MRKLLLVIPLAFALAGCATIQRLENIVQSAGSVTVSPRLVAVAAQSFDALEATATNYLLLKRCSAASGPVCRDPAATRVLIPAIRNARQNRNALEQFLRTHPGQLGPSGLYDALQASITAVTGIMQTYHIGTVQ